MARRSPRSRLGILGIPLLLLVFTLSACGARDVTDRMPNPTATSVPDEPTPVAAPGDEGTLLLQLQHFNGQPPEPEFATSGPHFNLYSDGRVITPGIYDGSTIVRPLQVTLLSEAGVQTILDEARSAGLLEAQSYTNAPWVDDPYILLTSYLGDAPVIVSAHVMGFIPDMDPEETTLSERLGAFSDKMFGLADWLPDGSILERDLPFEPQRLQIATSPLSSSGNESILPWPLDTPLEGLGEPGFLESMHCFILEGEQMQTVLTAFDEADELGYYQPLWQSDRKYYQVYPRLLPPGDRECYVVGASKPTRVYADGDTIEHGILPGNVLFSVKLLGASTTEEHLQAFPLVTLLGDGSVVTPPPPGEDGLLLRTPQVTRISEAGVQILLQEARAAGLLDGSHRYSAVDPNLPNDGLPYLPGRDPPGDNHRSRS